MIWEIIRTIWLIIGCLVLAGGVAMVVGSWLGKIDGDGTP